MKNLETADLYRLVQNLTDPSDVAPHSVAPTVTRALSIWEITTWILPMASEHLRRVLAQTPTLPQGVAGSDGGTRWFSPADVAALRAHFSQSSRRSRYLPQRPVGARAPVVAMLGAHGGTGRSVAVLHLATAAALAGYRVLVVDGDPAGHLGARLGLEVPSVATAQRKTPNPLVPGLIPGAGILSILAQSAARHLREANQARLDRGQEPLPMEDALADALGQRLGDLVRPSRWPGLDVLSASPLMMQADQQITAWRMGMRDWQPWRAIAQAMDALGWRGSYDLILCDTGRGLGPLAMAVLASADVLVMPVPLVGSVLHRLEEMATGLQSLADVTASLDAEAQRNARALGQSTQALSWRRLLALPTRAQGSAAASLAALGARLGSSLLANPLPEVPLLAGRGTRSPAVGQFYDLDYREVGRLAYAPLRDASEAAWAGLEDVIAQMWAQDAAQHAPQASSEL